MKRLLILFVMALFFGCIGGGQKEKPSPSPLPTATISPGELEANVSNLSAEIAEIESMGEELEDITNLTISESDLDALINES